MIRLLAVLIELLWPTEHTEVSPAALYYWERAGS